MSGDARATVEYHEAANGRAAYFSAGDRRNPAIVLLHGACMNADMFAGQIDAVERRFHVLAIDLPGLGRSQALTFSIPAAFCCVAKILDHEKITSCHFVGQSMGGIICQLLMQDRPELAKSLTLIGSVPLSAPLYRWKSLPFFLVAGIIRIAPRMPVHRLIALAAGSLPGTRRFIKACLRTFDRASLARIVRGIGNILKAGPYPEPAGGAEMPVLVINGTRDFLALGLNRYLTRRWAARLGFTVHAIPEASHNTNMDRPDDVNRLIADFLRTVPDEPDRSIAALDKFG